MPAKKIKGHSVAAKKKVARKPKEFRSKGLAAKAPRRMRVGPAASLPMVPLLRKPRVPLKPQMVGRTEWRKSGESNEQMAPSAVWDTSMKRSLHFASTPDGRGLVVNCSMPLAYIGVSNVLGGMTSGFLMDATTTPGGAPSVNQQLATLMMHPIRMAGLYARSGVLSAISDAYPNAATLASLCLNFGRYTLRNGGFWLTYEPQQTTIVPQRYCLGFVDDPYHPVMGGRAYENALPPSIQTCEEGENSVSFPPWLGWRKFFPTRENELFMFAPTGLALIQCR